MTKEEALKVLDTIPTIGEQVDALEMAIKALEQQPCEDCISRQAVTDMLTQEWTKYIPMELDINLSFVLEKINELPSVTSQPKVGEWLKNGELCKCSRCGSNVLFSAIKSYNYCYHCGSYNGGE